MAGRCGACKSQLRLLGAFNADGTPCKPRAATAYSTFMKENFSALKLQHPQKTQPELLREMAALWRVRAPDAHAGAVDRKVDSAAKPQGATGSNAVILISDSDDEAI